MHKGIYDTSFSNMQIIFAGQGGTTSGRLTATRKNLKMQKKSMTQQIKNKWRTYIGIQ